MKSLEYYWYQPNFLIWFLLPLSWLYCLVVFIRRRLYQLNLLKSYTSRVPVVIVGNIVAGGSGKTPLLISLCGYLQQNGFRPGVVSRGYGGSVTGVKQLAEGDSAELVGDEPLMISQRTQIPVVVGADRVAAVDYLLENNQCDIVLSDDGLQHYRMRRDFEIAVVDAAREFGNGFCLPAGPLREPASRLNDVDIVVYNGINTEASAAEKCFYRLQVLDLVKINGEECRSIESFKGEKIHAVAGIGNPARFFAQLRRYGLELAEHAFPDHHHYCHDDFSRMDSGYIIMTEKDAVKCRYLSLDNAWVLPVMAEFSETLTSSLNHKLLPLLDRQRKQ